jgi:acetyltransferase-like isoleucine patch superfamily enzyme
MMSNVPQNVQIGADSVVMGPQLFRRFFSQRDPAVVIGAHCHLEDVQLALGKQARVQLGDYVFAASLMLLCEQEIRIGDRVFCSFNVVIADTDFHPIEPAERIADAIAISPLSRGVARPPIITAAVEVGDDVWIGPNVTILKGVRIGSGAFLEPGSLVTRDVPPRARVLGNPAQIIGTV